MKVLKKDAIIAVVEPATFHIELSEEEAKVLRSILGATNGNCGTVNLFHMYRSFDEVLNCEDELEVDLSQGVISFIND